MDLPEVNGRNARDLSSSEIVVKDLARGRQSLILSVFRGKRNGMDDRH